MEQKEEGKPGSRDVLVTALSLWRDTMTQAVCNTKCFIEGLLTVSESESMTTMGKVAGWQAWCWGSS